MAGKNGGPRPGGGRPPGSLNKATLSANEQKAIARQVIRDYILEHIPQMVLANIDNACGVSYMVLRNGDGSFVEATNESQVKAAIQAGSMLLVEEPDGRMRWASTIDGEKPARIYTRQPHQGSTAMLLAYAADKPVEPHEHTGEGGGPVVFSWQK